MTETLWTLGFDSPIGALRVASSDLGLAYVELPKASGRGFQGWHQRHAKNADIKEDAARNRVPVEQILEYLEGARTEFDVPLDVRGTQFQCAVYREVAAIPYGSTRSYGEVAIAVDRPKAVRAVGAANGANPIPLIVPCHRVIASSGQLQGYAGGLTMKAQLLAMEGARPEQGKLL